MACEQEVLPGRWQETTACKVKIRLPAFEATVQAVLELVFALAVCGRAERCHFCFLWALEARVLLRCIYLLADHWRHCILHQFPVSQEARGSSVESRCIPGLPVPVGRVARAPRRHDGARHRRTVFPPLVSSCGLALHAAGPGRTGA